MNRRFAGALVAVVVCAGVAACGDTRSNQELNGVATWPAGGPAHGAWVEPVPPTYSYGSTTETTTTTTTVRPGIR